MFVRAGCQWQLRKVTFFLPSTAWRLHSFVRLQYSKLALFNPPLLDLAVTVTFGLQLFVFVYDLPLEQGFSLCFSLEIAIGCPFFFFSLSCMRVPPGLTHMCYSRFHWQREVNVIRSPLPRTTNGPYFGTCLHASSWSKLMQIFSGGVYLPSATSHTITFSISNSFFVNTTDFLLMRPGPRFCG